MFLGDDKYFGERERWGTGKEELQIEINKATSLFQQKMEEWRFQCDKLLFVRAVCCLPVFKNIQVEESVKETFQI